MNWASNAPLVSMTPFGELSRSIATRIHCVPHRDKVIDR